MVMKKTADREEIVIHEVKMATMDFWLLGTSPIILNRMSQKAWHELLFPQKKTTASKAANMKHDPVREFRDSPYRMADPKAPALLAVPPTAFKLAMCTAALYAEGVNKRDIERLVRVDWDRVPLYGVPRLHMSITRSADMNRTPDVRTRAILSEWAAKITMMYPLNLLRAQSIANLMSSGGLLSGVGDWRQEKGSGSFGAFRIADPNDRELQRIIAEGGRLAQQEALDHPVPYDEEAEEMLQWFGEQVIERGFQGKSQTVLHGVTKDDPAPDAPRELIQQAKAARKQRGNGARVS